MLAQIGPSAIGQTLPDLWSDNHPVASADVLYLVVYWQHLHTADLKKTHRGEENTVDGYKEDETSCMQTFLISATAEDL